MYLFNGHLQRVRTQEAFREDAWGQSDAGLIFPLAREEAKREEPPKIEKSRADIKKNRAKDDHEEDEESDAEQMSLF